MTRRRKIEWGKGLILFAILVALVVTVVILVRKNSSDEGSNKPQTTIDTSSSKDKETKEKETENKASDEVNNLPEEKVPQYEGDSPNKAENLTGLISYIGVTGNNLVVRVSIDQFLESGSCKINIVKDGSKIFSQTVSIQESVTTSTCDGFDIPVAQLTNGNLQVEIILESGDRSGKIVGETHI